MSIAWKEETMLEKEFSLLSSGSSIRGDRRYKSDTREPMAGVYCHTLPAPHLVTHHKTPAQHRPLTSATFARHVINFLFSINGFLSHVENRLFSSAYTLRSLRVFVHNAYVHKSSVARRICPSQ